MLRELIVVFVRDDLNAVLSLLAGIMLVGHKVPRKSHFIWRVFTCLTVTFMWSTVCNYLRHGPGSATYLPLSIIKYLLLFILTIVGAFFCFRFHFFAAIFCATIAYCLEHISQRIMGIIRLYVVNLPVLLDRAILLVVVVIVFTSIYYALIRAYVHYGEKIVVDNRLQILTALSVILTDTVLNTIALGDASRLGATRILICVHIFSIVSSIMALLISMCQMREAKTSVEADTILQMLHSERIQYFRDKATIDVINIKSHDLKHQLEVLGGQIDRRELEEMQKAVDVYDSAVKTENAALDVVLSHKSLLCLSKGIALTCIADGRRLSSISDPDIYSLFSNILDNAIEAAERLTDSEKKVIGLTVTARNAFVFIHTENYYDGDLFFADGLPQTTKENQQYHGFGMRSIRALTEKYGGDLHVDAREGIFKLDIMLPQ